MRQIRPNVYTEDRFSVAPENRGCNPSYITTSDGIVMVDTPFMAADSLALRQEMAGKGEVRYIVNTHHHVDHTSGNFFFPGTVVSHEKMREMYFAPLSRVSGSERYLEKISMPDYYRMRMREKDPGGPEVPREYYYRPATITFGDRMHLFAGGRVIELMHTPGHTADHIGVFLPEEKVFFAGDTVCNQEYPSFVHALPLEWLQTLDRILALDAEIIVPGHGRVCDKAAVREFAIIVERCVDMVRQAISSGMGPDEAAQKVSFDEIMPAHHPGPEMQRRNVLRMYQMLM